MEKCVLVTGTSGGIGKAVAMRLLDAGYEVFGCNRRDSGIQQEHFHPIHMDITSQESVEEAREAVSEYTDRLDAIVNISGVMFMGSVLDLPAERMQQILNVNLIGMYRVNRTFFPMVEKAKGRIINFSSEYGTYAVVPFNAFYTTSKHAVESYSDGLRRELRYLGIPVVTIRPGAFKTDMEKSTADQFSRLIATSAHFSDVLKKMEPLLVNGTKNAKDPDVMAEVTMKAITDRKPRRVYKCNHNIGTKLMSKLPSGLVDEIFYRMFK